MNSGLNTYMLRLGEVYLNYAEAVLGNNASTSDPTALMYVNRLRERAGLQPKTTLTFEDRKSTRLNSSHVKISYAVFCLKKKTEYGAKIQYGIWRIVVFF